MPTAGTTRAGSDTFMPEVFYFGLNIEQILASVNGDRRIILSQDFHETEQLFPYQILLDSSTAASSVQVAPSGTVLLTPCEVTVVSTFSESLLPCLTGPLMLFHCRHVIKERFYKAGFDRGISPVLQPRALPQANGMKLGEKIKVHEIQGASEPWLCR